MLLSPHQSIPLAVGFCMWRMGRSSIGVRLELSQLLRPLRLPTCHSEDRKFERGPLTPTRSRAVFAVVLGGAGAAHECNHPLALEKLRPGSRIQDAGGDDCPWAEPSWTCCGSCRPIEV